MRCFGRLVAVLFTGMAFGAFAAGARAGERVDTTYGRLDGDLGVDFGAGATFGPRGPRGTLDVRLRYMDTAGVFSSYEDAIVATGSDPRRVLATGFEIRPLFLARWLVGREFGVPRLDLFFDSLGLELATFFEQPSGGPFSSAPGLQASLGLEVPVLARASGPWIAFHGGARWSDASLEGQPVAAPHDRALFLSVTLSYHQIFAAHVADIRDTAPQ
jgi:hypothetical protein